MTERRKLILEISVDDFINTAHLITSSYLYNKYDFGIKPAMIRRELNELDKEKFLYQVHPSGGRVPTNKAYKFYVKNLQKKATGLDIIEEKQYEMYNDLLSQKLDDYTELMADYLDLLSVVYKPKNNEFYFSGLKNLFEAISTESKEDLLGIICDIEELPRRLLKESDSIRKKNLNIFIGGSPITKSEYLSVMSKNFVYKNNKFILLTIGPKRMDYRKSLCIFDFFDKELN